MSDVVCFWVDPVEVTRLLVGRHQDACPLKPGQWHDASVQIATLTYETDSSGCMIVRSGDVALVGADCEVESDDPRFPTTCACGQALSRREISHEVIYASDDGRRFEGIASLPPGAMFRAPWYESAPFTDSAHGETLFRRGADGQVLGVVTPGGTWFIDQRSAQGTFWTRTGTPPRITAHPSIHIIGSYHGWLRDGVLVSC